MDEDLAAADETDVILHDIRPRLKDLSDAISDLGDCGFGILSIQHFSQAVSQAVLEAGNEDPSKVVEGMLREAMDLVRQSSGDTDPGAEPPTICFAFLDDQITSELASMEEEVELTEAGEAAIEEDL